MKPGLTKEHPIQVAEGPAEDCGVLESLGGATMLKSHGALLVSG
jgi:hypothetical protein